MRWMEWADSTGKHKKDHGQQIFFLFFCYLLQKYKRLLCLIDLLNSDLFFIVIVFRFIEIFNLTFKEVLS